MKYSTLILGLCLVALVATGVSAQGTVYVPDNVPTTGSANSWPFNVNTHWSYLYVLNASTLPSAPFKITDIAFAPTTTRNPWACKGRFQIRMANTTVASVNSTTCFKDVLGACATVVEDVPSKKWTATSGTWSPIGLSCSHGYDGRSNLAIHIRYNAGPGGSGTAVRYFGGSTVSRAYHRGTTNAVFTQACATQGDANGPKTCLSIDRTCVMLASSTVKVGQTLGVQILQPTVSTGSYQIAASLSQGPPINLGNCRLCLGVDPLFLTSILGGPPVFNGYSGAVTPNGAAAKMAIPNIPALAGLCVYHAGVIFDRSGIRCCTNTAGTEIVP